MGTILRPEFDRILISVVASDADPLLKMDVRPDRKECNNIKKRKRSSVCLLKDVVSLA